MRQREYTAFSYFLLSPRSYLRSHRHESSIHAPEILSAFLFRKQCQLHTHHLLRLEAATKRSPMRSFHVFVRLAHGVVISQAEPAVVGSAAGTLDMEASVDSDAGCVAARAEFSADTLEIVLQSFVLWIAASLALCACFSEVVLRLAGCAVDGEAFWADYLVHAFDDGEVLVAVRAGAVDELVGILLAHSLLVQDLHRDVRDGIQTWRKYETDVITLKI